ncbi:MAG: threonine/serine dehydratase [Alphaproteobacteria bacterium]|nr:threonine/serine dehydratase [Alphaproteobacteria bacterium]
MLSAAILEAAYERVRPYVRRTPLVAMTPTGLGLKAESLQPTGAFKLRGAFNAILSLGQEARARGVVAHSSGNHAQAVAYAANVLSVRAVIVMPENAPAVKREGTQRWGAEIVTVAPGGSERARRAAELAAERGLTPIPPFNSLDIIAGAAGVGLEILQDRPNVERIYVSVSGGGQIAGVAAAVAAFRPHVEVVAVEPALSGHASASLAAGHPVAVSDAEAGRTIADGLRVSRLGEASWAIVKSVVQRAIAVTDEEITAAMRRIAAEARLVAEPSGAAAIAGALKDRSPTDESVAVLSGGNVDPALFASILLGGERGA